MKKITLFIICLCIGVFLVWKFQSSIRQSTNNVRKANLHEITVGSSKLSVEIAQTVPEITLGLGKRDVLGSDGMLFVLPARVVPTFWMKDMRFDLDFVWIDTHTIIGVTENVSAQKGEPDSSLRMYSPRSSATHVLEMNAGEVKKRGIKVGDTVQL